MFKFQVCHALVLVLQLYLLLSHRKRNEGFLIMPSPQYSSIVGAETTGILDLSPAVASARHFIILPIKHIPRLSWTEAFSSDDTWSSRQEAHIP